MTTAICLFMHQHFRLEIVACPLRNAAKKLPTSLLIAKLEKLNMRIVIFVIPEEIVPFLFGKRLCGTIQDSDCSAMVDHDGHDLKLQTVLPQKPICMLAKIGGHTLRIHGIRGRERALERHVQG